MRSTSCEYCSLLCSQPRAPAVVGLGCSVCSSIAGSGTLLPDFYICRILVALLRDTFLCSLIFWGPMRLLLQAWLHYQALDPGACAGTVC